MASDKVDIPPPSAKAFNQGASVVVRQVKQYLTALADAGCPGFECSPKVLETIETWTGFPPKQAETLETIQAELGDCHRCRLGDRRTHIVYGTGDPGAGLVFVGEAPGYEEDIQGEPFVGPAGRLLTKIIQAINLTREQVYICNIIKCRPPNNRNPEPSEIDACRPFLERQLEVIRPDFICALGSIAAQTLLKTTLSISRLRGRFYNCCGARLLPTFHPSYLLRNPEKKRDVWNDMKMLMAEMENKIHTGVK